jgi:drug/metabolite transporter (DMT)-like permease
MGIALALAAMLGFAVNILLTRYAVARMPLEAGFFVVLATNIVFPGVLCGIEFAARPTAFSWNWTGTGFFAIAGLVGTFMGRRFLFDAVRLLGPSRASVFHSSAPAFALLGAWLLAGERLGAYELALCAVVWVGLWFTQPQAGIGGPALDREAWRKGMIAGLGAVAGFGFGNVLRGLAMREWSEALLGTVIATLAAVVLQVAVTRNWTKIAAQFRAADRTAIALYVGCGVATSLGSIFVTLAMTHMEIGLAVLVVHTTPLVIFPVSVFVLGSREELMPRTIFGALLVLCGITLLAIR